MLAGIAFCEMPTQYPRSAFQGLCGGHQKGSAAVCDPNPPRPFARYRFKGAQQLPPNCAIPPLVRSFTQAHLCDTPFCNVSRDNCAIPHKNKHERVLRHYRCKYRAIFIDLLMGLFRGAVFCHGRGGLKQPIKQPTETPTSTLALMGRFPSLMGRFPTLMGRFTGFVLRGRFTS